MTAQTPLAARHYDARTGWRTVLVHKTGRKWLHAVALDHPPVRVVRFKLAELDKMTPLALRNKPYPIGRAVRRFLKAGRVLGITTGARRALKSIAK